eukprot:760955-Hanusia_phi.AAC.6
MMRCGEINKYEWNKHLPSPHTSQSINVLKVFEAGLRAHQQTRSAEKIRSKPEEKIIEIDKARSKISSGACGCLHALTGARLDLRPSDKKRVLR